MQRIVSRRFSLHVHVNSRSSLSGTHPNLHRWLPTRNFCAKDVVLNWKVGARIVNTCACNHLAPWQTLASARLNKLKERSHDLIAVCLLRANCGGKIKRNGQSNSGSHPLPESYFGGGGVPLLPDNAALARSLGNRIRESGVRTLCANRRCGFENEFPYWLFSLIVFTGLSIEARFLPLLSEPSRELIPNSVSGSYLR